VLTEALAAGGAEAKRAFDAMMDMRKMTSPRSRRRGAGDFHHRGFQHCCGAACMRVQFVRALWTGL